MSLALSLLKRLQRTTSSGRFLAEIDGLRFISIASVLMFHITAHIIRKLQIHPRGFGWDLLLTGSFGVEVFFAISGFILALPFAEWRIRDGKPVQLSRYYMRRVTRIEPPYMINMLLMFLCVPILATSLTTTYLQQVPHLFASLGYVHDVIYNEKSPLNGVAWSLEIEIQFYLLAPVLCQLFRLRNMLARRAVLLSGILGLAAAASAGLADAGRWHYTLPPYLQYFLAGFFVADLYCGSWDGAPSHSRKWDYIGVLTAIGLVMVLPPPVDGITAAKWTSVLLPFLVILLMTSAFRSKAFRASLIYLPVTVIGGMCYTIYLYHFPIISAVTRPLFRILSPAMPPWQILLITSAVSLPAVLAISSVFFLLIEKPFMNYGVRRKNLARRAAVPTQDHRVLPGEYVNPSA